MMPREKIAAGRSHDATPKSRKTSRTDVNFCLDFALLLLFLTVCTLSVILEFGKSIAV
jgi:hypothetical protein